LTKGIFGRKKLSIVRQAKIYRPGLNRNVMKVTILIQAHNAQLTNEQTLLFIFWVCF